MHCILKSAIKCLKPKTLNTCALALYKDHLNCVENLVKNKITVQNPDWGAIRKEALEIDTKRITQTNVDYFILSQCNDESTHKFAVKYAQYLEKNGTQLNLAVIGRLLKIYGSIQGQEETQKSITNIEIEVEIIKLYKQLIDKYKVLDANLTESVIMALSKTKNWKDCLKLMESLQLHGSPTAPTYSALICALFGHGEEELAWFYLQAMVDSEKMPGSSIYYTYLSSIDKEKDYAKFVLKAERIFEFWSMNDILINENVALKLNELFASRQKRAVITTINVRGNCFKCKTKLPHTTISDDGFSELKSAFFQRVIIGKDVFRKTTPDELRAFKTFVEDKQHYDVIIDGLNVAYSTGVRKPVEVTSGLVASVVEHYARQNKSVLVLGRTHMKKWPHIGKIKNYAKLFLTQNLSQDDPYLLYCALNSGAGTIIVSRDMMRGHLHLLKEPHLKQLFKRWLSITRHQLLTMSRDGKLVINAPPAFIHSAQKVENVWHLPIIQKTDGQKSSLPQKSEPTLWLCAQL